MLNSAMSRLLFYRPVAIVCAVLLEEQLDCEQHL